MPNSTLFLFVGIGFEFLSRRFADKSATLSVRWAIVGLCVWLQFVKNFDKQDQVMILLAPSLTLTSVIVTELCRGVCDEDCDRDAAP